MEFGKSNWRNFEQGIQKEWLLTNGIGGFSSSTIIGANTRRYHGLLVAALKPPVRRHLILSKVDESIAIDGQIYNLYSSKTPEHIMMGYLHLQRVIVDPIPTFVYSIGDVYLEKTVCMVYGENTTIVFYHVKNGQSSAKLRLTPLVNFRDYHHNSSRQYMHFTCQKRKQSVVVNPSGTNVNIGIYCSEGIFTEACNSYYMNMEYPVERERGLPPLEDHYIPGYFDICIKPWQDICITITATVENNIVLRDGLEVIDSERARLNELADMSGYRDDLARRLVLASDAFIVRRESTGSKTVIAGYPWFTDWGRDAMIAFTGITLSTRRFDDARDILHTFAKHIRDGLIPNVFPDEGGEPAYNTVDAPLWYFEAVNKFLNYTADYLFVYSNLFDALKQIIGCYINGTHYNIKMDEDFLITSGDEGTQLTWMDAKVGGWVVTPRHGKAVEVNALWYNALKVMERLSKASEDDDKIYGNLAQKVKDSFADSFWNDEKQCLYDVITGDFKDSKVRPNQILAVSLSYPVMEGSKAKMVVNRVWKELYASYGLRSLSPLEREYRGGYFGNQYERDGAYHQGTVWAWLIGHFITGFMKVNGYTESARQTALRFIKPFKDHLHDACVGYISEIFDGDEPHIPRGCFAQAWSVGEILRAYTEDILDKRI